MKDSDQTTYFLSNTGVDIPTFLFEPQSLTCKKVRDKDDSPMHYIPPAPRPHHVISAPSQTKLIHSRSGIDSQDLDNSFQLLMSGGETLNIFKATFDIQERLGFGSFGDVFRVKSKLNGREYAVKKSRRVYSCEADRARQLREVNRMTDIEPNPHLVELNSAWEEDGHLFFQLELCSKSLNQKIEEGSFLCEQECWDVLIDMLHALEHLHKNLLVHMDVKPDNIFLSVDSPTKYKLGDFGIIVCLKEKRDMSEFTEGDSRYLAPEVIQGCVTTKADVFSLGLTMLEICCNVDLPKGGNLWHQLRNGEFPEPTNSLIPASLKPIIRQMLNPDVNSRPEIKELLRLPIVKERVYQRKWGFRKAWILQKFSFLFQLLIAFVTLVKSVLFKNEHQCENSVPVENDRKTLECLPATPEQHPSVLLNDISFSDDEDVTVTRTPSLVFASTPISHSKTRSGGKFRNRRQHLLSNVADSETLPMGNSSRNLLRDFEDISD